MWSAKPQIVAVLRFSRGSGFARTSGRENKIPPTVYSLAQKFAISGPRNFLKFWTREIRDLQYFDHVYTMDVIRTVSIVLSRILTDTISSGQARSSPLPKWCRIWQLNYAGYAVERLLAMTIAESNKFRSYSNALRADG